MNPLQTGMFPQSQMDKTQFATPTQMPVSREIVASDYDTQVNPYTGEMPRFDKGGEVGIKSLAKDLAQYGRNGDTMVAHINPQEAAMLKTMGGSGTINPHTGLPEFGFNPIKAISQGVKSIVQPVYNATLKNIPGVDQALVGLDKTIGNTIPGGWGTLASAAASFIPGGQLAALGMTPTGLATGLGALTGSGSLRPNGKFSLQGALMGGAAAYGMANLSNAIQAAGNVTPPGTPSVDIPTAPTVPVGEAAVPGIGTSSLPSGGINPAPGATSGVGFNTSGLSSGVSPNLSPTPGIGDSISKFAGDYGRNVSNFGQGIANLSGLGPEGVTSKAAMEAATNTGAKLTNTVLPMAMGTMGLSDLEAQRNYEKDMAASGNAANNQYNAQMAALAEDQNRAYDAMRKNPYRFAEGGSMPRFLSGGGDGLSDDIPATIEDKQPARLADGEFVVSADVVSGLGGGSSKAGAKKLYSMMDRVRKQAHGSKKQIRPVSNKALPA